MAEKPFNPAKAYDPKANQINRPEPAKPGEFKTTTFPSLEDQRKAEESAAGAFEAAAEGKPEATDILVTDAKTGGVPKLDHYPGFARRQQQKIKEFRKRSGS